MATKQKRKISRLLKNGLLPIGMEHIARESSFLRSKLEEAILLLRKNLTLYEVALIKSASIHEATVRMLGYYLRNEQGLSIENKLAILRDIRSATTARDKCIEGLNVNHDPKVLAIESIYEDGEK